MRRRLALLALALIGCADATGPDLMLRRLSLNEQRWKSLGASNYDYQLEVDCFCTAVGPRRVEVRHGLVARVVYLNSGQEAPSPSNRWTIDSFFTVIRSALAAGEPVEVIYGPNFFPSQFTIGTLANDAGSRIWATKFVRR